MADLDERALIDAGLDLLRSDPGLSVYPDPDGLVPAVPARPFARAYATVEHPPGIAGLANTIDGASRTAVVRWWVHCVADTEPGAIAVGMRVRAALLDARLQVAGWSCGMVRQEACPPPVRDEVAGVAVYDQVAVYLMTAAG